MKVPNHSIIIFKPSKGIHGGLSSFHGFGDSTGLGCEPNPLGGGSWIYIPLILRELVCTTSTLVLPDSCDTYTKTKFLGIIEAYRPTLSSGPSIYELTLRTQSGDSLCNLYMDDLNFERNIKLHLGFTPIEPSYPL